MSLFLCTSMAFGMMRRNGQPYYLRPDGKVGHDAFAVIRETIREMNMVAIGRVGAG